MKNHQKKKSSSLLKSIESKNRRSGDELLQGQNLIFRVSLAAILIIGITFLYPIDKIYLPIEIPQR